jgi:O-antigen/teichoic acid export membrane protein
MVRRWRREQGGRESALHDGGLVNRSLRAEQSSSLELDRAIALVGAGALASAASSTLVLVAAFFTTVLMVRLLGTKAYGALAFGMSIVGNGASVTRLGFGPATQRTIAAYVAGGDHDEAAETVSGLGALVLLGGSIGAMVVILVEMMTQHQLGTTERLLLGIGLGILLVGRNTAAAAATVAGGFGRPVIMIVPTVVVAAAQFTAALALALSGAGRLTAVGLGYGLAGLFSGVIAADTVRRLLRSWRKLRPLARPALALLRIAGPFAVVGVAGIIIASFDVAVLGVIRPGEPVGAYAPVLALVETLTLLPVSLFRTLFVPAATRLLAGGEQPDFARFYLAISKLAVIAAVPAILLFATSPADVLKTAYGPRFPVSSPTVWILLVGFFVHLAFGFNGQALVAWGNARTITRAFIGPTAWMIVSSLTLIPWLGSQGAALATASSYVVLNVSLSLALHHETQVHPFHRELLLVVASSPLGLGMALAIKSHLPEGFWPTVLSSAIAWGVWVCLLLLVRAFRLSELKAFGRARRTRTGEEVP